MAPNAFQLASPRQRVVIIILMIVFYSNDVTSFGQEQAAGVKYNRGASTIEISENAKELGFDVKKLKSIDRKLRGKIKDGDPIGCSGLIFKDGQVVYYGEWGFQNKRKEIPIKRNTIFRIYSMTKPVTSIAAMQLVEQGKLDLDVPIETYLPEFKNLTVLEDKRGATEVPAKRKMTTRDLMRHTSGLTYGFFGNTEVDKKYRAAGALMTDLNLASTVSKLAKIPLLNHPATKFHYSASTDVLGRVIEVVSEQPLDEYFKTQIFEPLDMSDTFFAIPSEKLERFAQLYRPDGNGGLRPANPLQSIRYLENDLTFFSGGGGLCSTIDDYLKFSRMLLNEGAVAPKESPAKSTDEAEAVNDSLEKAKAIQIVQPETLKQMFTNQLIDIERPSGRQFKFGLGFRIFKEGDYGWGGAAGTRFWVNPEKNLAILFMTQIMPYGRRGLGESMREAVYSSLR
jgi:CubicO group peptidase (beta-lactamase class C family)